MDGVVVALVTISPLILIAALVLVPQWIAARERQALLVTLESMAEKGHALSPDTIAALTQPPRPSREKDQRRAGILLALWGGLILVGIAMWIALFLNGVPNAYAALFVLFGIGAVPGCFGLAFFAFSRAKTAA